MMVYHVTAHKTSVAIVDAESPEAAVKLVEADQSLLKTLQEDFMIQLHQDKDLN